MDLYGKLTMQLYDAVACTSMQLNDTTVCNSAMQLYAAVLCSCMKLDYATAVTTPLHAASQPLYTSFIVFITLIVSFSDDVPSEKVLLGNSFCLRVIEN